MMCWHYFVHPDIFPEFNELVTLLSFYFFGLLPKRRVNSWIRAGLWSQAKKGSWVHLTAFIPRFSQVKVLFLFQRTVYLKSEETFLPDQWYVKLSACAIKLILREAKGTRLWTFSHVKPKYWAKWCVFSGRTDSSELQVVTGIELFVFNSKSPLVFVFFLCGTL